jgi:predicted DCC family thiol-disulfide oxidoreductase YuxK
VGDDWRYLVLYDGACGLCDASVQWLLRHDRRGVLRFAPLQGTTARRWVTEQAPDEAQQTIVLVERGADGRERVSDRSTAAFRILGALGGAWRALSWLRLLPRALTDAVYRFVARRRRRWFAPPAGDVACRVPDAATRARFYP